MAANDHIVERFNAVTGYLGLADQMIQFGDESMEASDYTAAVILYGRSVEIVGIAQQMLHRVHTDNTNISKLTTSLNGIEHINRFLCKRFDNTISDPRKRYSAEECSKVRDAVIDLLSGVTASHPEFTAAVHHHALIAPVTQTTSEIKVDSPHFRGPGM